MRNLTIKRRKSVVGCAMKMKVYLEDPISGDFTINGVLCRKLGDLKNNEEKTFTIGSEEARVFVIADRLSKNYCNESVRIPAGDEDVQLSGKNHFNPFAGNPFWFDGPVDFEMLKNRNKSRNKSAAVMVAALLIGVALGLFFTFNSLSASRKEAKHFSENGMEITLTREFRKVQMDGFEASFTSKKAAVFAIKEEFDLVEGFGDLTVEEYGELVIEGNGMEVGSKVKNDIGFPYFEYTRENEKLKCDYHYFAVLFKGEDAFWMVQFAVPEADITEYRPLFIDWAKTIEFTNS